MSWDQPIAMMPGKRLKDNAGLRYVILGTVKAKPKHRHLIAKPKTVWASPASEYQPKPRNGARVLPALG
jgi:hypothetical protein